MTSDSDPIARSIKAGADDHERPLGFEVGDVLASGRRAVRRRRLFASVGAFCAVGLVLAGGYVAPSLLTATRTPGGYDPQGRVVFPPTPSTLSTPTRSATSPARDAGDWREALRSLDRRAVLARCAGQFDPKRAAAARAGKVHLSPSRKAYALGQQVTVSDADFDADPGYVRWFDVCTIPGRWTPDTPVDLSKGAPRPDDTEAILRACSATIRVDLREWRVHSAMPDGENGLAAVLTSPGSDPYVAFCNLEPAWLAKKDLSFKSGVEIRTAGPLSELSRRAEKRSLQSIVTLDARACEVCTGTRYGGSGVLPPNVARLRIEIGSDRLAEVPIRDGLYALRFMDRSRDAPVRSYRITAYDKAGRQLASWDEW